jgi:hypothetical protein
VAQCVDSEVAHAHLGVSKSEHVESMGAAMLAFIAHVNST